MEYLKKTIILKGDANASFVMQRSVGTKYSLIWHGTPKKGDILIFDDEGFHRLTSPSGMLPTDISAVNAIAVGDDLSVKGQLKPFNWSKARAMLASASRNPKSQTVIRPVSSTVPPQQLEQQAESQLQEISAPLAQYSQAVPSIPPEPVSPTVPPPPEKPPAAPNPMSSEAPSAIPASEQPVKPAPLPTTEFHCPMCEQREIPNPFPREYPRSKWLLYEYPSAKGKWHYLTGKLYNNSGQLIATALALPGSSGIKPAGNGFNSYRLSADGRGYWIRTIKV